MRHVRNLAMGILFPLCIGILIGRGLISSALTNAGMVALVKAGLCKKGDLTCHTNYLRLEENQAQGERARRWLETALTWQPNSLDIRLHLAEVYFGLGLRHQAADMAAVLASYPAGRSPLVDSGVSRHYEHYLLNAEQMATEGRWTEAVQNFRIGLAWGGNQTLPIDILDFNNALANLYMEQAQANPATARMLYLTGKYLFRSGNWPAALSWLEQAAAIKGTGKLTPEDAGRVQTYTGQILEGQGDLAGASKAYEQAIADSPNLREGYVYLIHLLLVEGETSSADRIRTRLATLGPGTILGRQAINFQVPDPVTLPDGWTLEGYDLDEETLESGGPIEMLLWWQKPGNTIMEGEAWTQAGSYWLERRTVTNLFPNAGFEWGTRQDGIPLGLNREFYGAAAGSLEVRSVLRNDLNTLALFANNDVQNPNVAVVSFPIQVDPAGYYLMAGWLWDEERSANIGRDCSWKGGAAPYYIAYGDLEPHRPFSTWVHIADLNVAFPGKQPVDSCNVILVNYRSEKKAIWDDILWVPISSP
jgi:tetratricopeptide (TPR) repeat protein